MDRQAKLIQVAGAVRRRIYASLPWAVRLATFMRSAISSPEAFGRGLEQYLNKLGLDTPSGWAASFGKQMYGFALSRTRNSTAAQDVLSEVMLKLLSASSRGSGIDPNRGLKEAESYVKQAIASAIVTHFRKKKHKGPGGESVIDVPDVIMDDDGLKLMEHESEESIPTEQKLKELLHRIRPKLERIHPDAPLYVKLSLFDNYDDREILGAKGNDPLLPHPYTQEGKKLYPSSWDPYKKKIMNVLNDAIADLV